MFWVELGWLEVCWHDGGSVFLRMGLGRVLVEEREVGGEWTLVVVEMALVVVMRA